MRVMLFIEGETDSPGKDTMELYKITSAVKVTENLSWNRVCDILVASDDGDVWGAHHWLEERGEYPFLSVSGDQMILTRM